MVPPRSRKRSILRKVLSVGVPVGVIIVFIATGCCLNLMSTGAAVAPTASPSDFYALSAKDAHGDDFSFESLRGKVVLIVNVASQCGFTGQYAGLAKLHEKYSEQGLVILGFPCNQFGAQEPGSAQEVVEFCSLKYQATFPIMEKVDVNGDNTCAVYQYLKAAKQQCFMSRGLMHKLRSAFRLSKPAPAVPNPAIKWNFEKFLVRRDGTVDSRYSSAATPSYLDPIIAKALAGEPGGAPEQQLDAK